MPRNALTRGVLDAQRAELGLPPYDGSDDDRALRRAALVAVLEAKEAGIEPQRPVLRGAVRYLLDLLVAAAPGKSVEVRVPPYAAVQCVEGPRHTRGTPPNVIEMDADTWIALATGALTWDEAAHDGLVRASGSRADLSPLLPITGEFGS